MNKFFKTLYITIILLFLYFPLIIVAVYSFNSTKSTTLWGGVTFDWYIKLFSNKSIISALLNSILLTVIVTVLSVILGTLGSIALNRFKTKLTKIFFPLVYLPVLTPEIIVGIAFLQIFSMLDLKFGLATLILSHISFCVPFVMIVVSARLNSLQNNLEEAARDLGASVWQAFFHITIPELLPGIISGAALAFIMSFDDVIISFFMSGATVTTLPVKVYSMMKVGVSPEINALSTIVLLITFVCVIVINVKKPTKNLL
ncbi:MAG: ABC transporter permease [Clostridia bacterium]|nr:ABC transporter permease [Clostridia bacterium]